MLQLIFSNPLISVPAILLILPLLRILYNISPFHPLARFPGPISYRASRLFWAYHHFKGNLVFQIKDLHDIYGPIVRVAPSELSFTNSAAWKDIYTTNNDLKQQLPRDPFVLPPPPPNISGDGLVMAADLPHGRLRKQLGYAFTTKALNEQQRLIQGHIDILIRQLREKSASAATNHVDFAKWASMATFDIVGELAFGEKMNCLARGDFNDLASRITGSNTAGALLSCLARFGLIDLVWKLNAKQVAKEQEIFNNMTLPIVERRMQEHEKGLERENKDFCSYILGEEGANDLPPWTKEDIQLLGISFIVAGTETTGTTLAATMWFLLKNERCLTKLVKEIRSTFQIEADIDVAGVSKLPYLLACIEEGLRLATPAPFSMARRTPADMTVAGIHVPRGTSVGVPQFAAWHDKRNFDRPMEFVPERWLNEGDFVPGEKRGFVPFGVGPRNCIGKSLAHHEMRLIIARLLWNFDFELSDPHFDFFKQQVYLVWVKEPIMLKVKSVRS